MSTDRPTQAEEQPAAEEPVLPETSADERAEGWGDEPREGRRDVQWYRRERPPHHE